MMRYVYTPHIQQIPQWKQCYYDYKLLNKVLKLIRQYSDLYQDTQRILAAYQQNKDKYKNNQLQTIRTTNLLNIPTQPSRNPSHNPQHPTSQNNLIVPSHSVHHHHHHLNIQQLKSLQAQLYDTMSIWCKEFTKYSYKCSSIVTMFVKMRHLQIQTKFQEYKRLFNVVKEQRHNILLLLQNLYVQNFYLSKAIAYNIAQQTKVSQQYQKFSIKYPQHYKISTQDKKLRRLKKINQVTLNQIEQKYLIVSTERQTKAFEILHEMTYSYKQAVTKDWQLTLVGLAMGVLALMITLLVMTDYINHVVLEENSIFTSHFPIWRGASYILFYLWIFSLDILFYQRSQINYPLIFQFKDHYMPSSKYILLRASILSIIYIVLFYLFTLKISNIIRTDFYHYGVIFWGILILHVFVNRILSLRKSSKRKSFNFYKMFLEILFTPCITINFMIIWVTEQFSSFNQPFGDFFYTICYVSNGNATFCTTNSIYASTTYILFIFLYRMIQNLKLWHQNTMATAEKRYDFKAGPFVGFFRGLLSFITTIFALLNRLNAFQGIFPIWLTLSIITTLYSWFIDIRYDWGILDRKSKNFLRQKLLFPQAKFLYYFIAIFNLVLRTAWVLTISNLIIVSKGMPQLIFVMIISYLQIFRRGVWNILRIENQHIKNCGQFKATITDRPILQSVQEKARIKEEKLKLIHEQLQKNSNQIVNDNSCKSNVNILNILIDYNQQIIQDNKINIERSKQNQQQEQIQLQLQQSQSPTPPQQPILKPTQSHINRTFLQLLIYVQKLRALEKKLTQTRKKQTKQVFKQHLQRKSEMRDTILTNMHHDRSRLFFVAVAVGKIRVRGFFGQGIGRQ